MSWFTPWVNVFAAMALCFSGPTIGSSGISLCGVVGYRLYCTHTASVPPCCCCPVRLIAHPLGLTQSNSGAYIHNRYTSAIASRSALGESAANIYNQQSVEAIICLREIPHEPSLESQFIEAASKQSLLPPLSRLQTEVVLLSRGVLDRPSRSSQQVLYCTYAHRIE